MASADFIGCAVGLPQWLVFTHTIAIPQLFKGDNLLSCLEHLASPTPKWLLDLSPAEIQKGPSRLMRNLAQDALVYPGARLDGSPVRECQGVIHSFIFLDYGTPKAEVMAELTRQRRSGTGFAHHRLVGVVEFDPTSIVTGADPAFIRDTSFNQGMSEAELEEELQEQLSKVANSLIFLSHAPPYGSRDLTLRGYHIGHRPLFRYLHDRDWPHSLIFCGHVHQSFGFEEVGATTILNVATGYALVEWNEIETSVIEMARLVDSPSFWDSP